MLTDLAKAPFPMFGGKQHAAPLVWEALGDVAHYVEPFCGSCAVLLRRPHPCNRTYYSETVNDADGLLVNALRGIQLHPDETAEAASWYVSEADLHARHLAILRWRAERDLERLMGDPDYCDPKIAGWWLWGICCWISGGWCSSTGPWVVNADGRIAKRQNGEPGVWRKRPHLGNNGQGVKRAGTREPGVKRALPHVTDNGQGVNRPQAREPGVAVGTPERPWEEGDFHPMTMPELRRWFAFLSARLRHVRILNGDWQRAVTTGAAKTLVVRQKQGVAGIFLDPPYAAEVRYAGLYTHDSDGLAAQTRAWCLEHGDDPDYRVVLAGFAGEGHEELEQHGWRVVEWYRAGHLRGGYANQGEEGTQQHRERLWLSPNCLGAAAPAQPALWEETC